MDVFLHKLVTISKTKYFGKVSSEMHLVGTNVDLSFLPKDDNLKIDGRYSVNIKDLRSEIDLLKKSSKTIVFKNGEPCLQRMALKNLATYAKQKGMHVVIETYGTLPNVIKDLVDKKLVDMIVLKLYFTLSEAWLNKLNRGKLISNNKELINGVKETLKFLASRKINVLAKIIVVPGLIDRNNDIGRICRNIEGIRNIVLELMPIDERVNEESLEELKNFVRKNYGSIKVR
ncbi:hypothetical protein H6503_00175 [Candidatus Woesearchaeota archaeon]|nr:hypothetical protein [Candidatus Woesearchaeota archaeon]